MNFNKIYKSLNNNISYFKMVEKKRSLDNKLSTAFRRSAFLGDILRLKMEEYHRTISISHFIATISGVILTLSLGKMALSSFLTEAPMVKLGVISIVGSSMITIILTLFTVGPTFKKNIDSNTFDYGTKLSDLTREEYIDSIVQNLNKEENMINSYGHELHRLDTIILHRFKMIKSSIYLFIFGLFLGGMLIIISTLIQF